MGRPKKDSKQVTIHFPVDRRGLTRTKRPGQKAPPARHGPRPLQQRQTGSMPRKSGISWRETVERRGAAWEVRRPAAERRFLASYLQVRNWETQKRAMILNHVQDRVREAFIRAKTLHKCCISPECNWQQMEDLKVAFVDIETRGFLQVPSSKCNACEEVISVEPEDIGCFPATPAQPVTWFGSNIMFAARFAALRGGFSAEGFIEMLDHLLVSVDPEDSSKKIEIRSNQLTEAYLEFGRLCIAVTDPDAAMPAKDPFRHCPACAITSRTNLSDGTPVPDCTLVVSADGMAKAVRYSAVGSALSKNPPGTSHYIGKLDRIVAESFENGRLQSISQARARTAETQANDEDRAFPACTSMLSASRATAASRGEVDRTGIVGITCSHLFPAEDLFLGMRTPEQHYYYDVLFEELVRVRPDLHTVNLDIACRYKNRWDALINRMIEQGVANEKARKILLLLPWMHAMDHNLDCQMSFSGLYKGIGWRHGEVVEQFWSLIKPLTKLARYMSSGHWQDAYNQALTMLAIERQDTFVELLQTRIKALESREEKHSKLSEDLNREASEYGVNDLDDALKALEELEAVQVEQCISLKAQYVQALRLLQAHTSLSSNRAAFALVIPGSLGIKLHAKGADDAYHGKLILKVERLAAQLDVPLGQEWKPGEQDYEDGLRELCGAMMSHYEGLIEEQVFKHKLIYQRKLQETGKNARYLLKQLTKIKNEVKHLLDIRRTWESEREVISSKLSLPEIMEGKYPWQDRSRTETCVGHAELADGSRATVSVAKYHFARRYRTLKSQIKRSAEENVLLQHDIIRFINWVEERQEEMVQLATHEDVLIDAFGLGSYESAVHKGKRSVLLDAVARLKAIQARAQQLRQFLKSMPHSNTA